MTDFTSRNPSTHLGVDRIFSSTTALALYYNLFAFAEGAPGAPRMPGALHMIDEVLVGAPASSVDFIAGIDDTYDEYLFELVNFVPVTDAVALRMRTDSNGGASFDAGASDYPWILSAHAASAEGTAVGNSTVSGVDRIDIAQSDVGAVGNSPSLGGFNGWVHLIDPGNTSRVKVVRWDGSFYVDGTDGIAIVRGAGYRNSTTPVNAAQFFFSSGNIAPGSIARMYGRNKQSFT